MDVAVHIDHPVSSRTDKDTKYASSFSESLVNGKPIQGLEFPFRSTILVPVLRRPNAKPLIVMSRSERIDKKSDGTTEKKYEWALAGGKVNSQKTAEDKITDTADQFVKDGKQLPSNECKQVIFESPKHCVAREVVEEMTGKKDLTDADYKAFDLIISKIRNASEKDWRIIKTVRDATFGPKNNEIIVKGFTGYTAICQISLTYDELNTLNELLKVYPNREHREFVPFDWNIITEQKGDKTKNVFSVLAENSYPIRKYNKDIMFVHYSKEFNDLVIG